jgi:hypothetical protein
VVGERDEHGFEHRQFRGLRAALGQQPERQLAERDPADQLASQVVTEERDRLERRGADPGPVRRAVVLSHPCSAATL